MLTTRKKSLFILDPKSVMNMNSKICSVLSIAGFFLLDKCLKKVC